MFPCTPTAPWGELLAFDGDVRTRRARDEHVGVAFERHAVILLPR